MQACTAIKCHHECICVMVIVNVNHAAAGRHTERRVGYIVPMCALIALKGHLWGRWPKQSVDVNSSSLVGIKI